MYELPIDQYYKVMHFLNNIADEIVFAHSVVEKKQKGIILVDDLEQPNVCLIHHYCGLGFLSGTTENETFNKMLLDILYKRLGSNPRNLRLIVNSVMWQNKLGELIGENIAVYSSFKSNSSFKQKQKVEELNALAMDHIIVWSRVKFKLNKEMFARVVNNFNIPSGLTISRIDEKLMSNIKGSIVPSYSWNSDEDFLKKGFGYCLMEGDNILSISFSAFVSLDKIDIGIETSPNYRGKGYGLLTGMAMIKYCIEKGFEPIWCCRQDNIASFSLAMKLGFEDTLYLPLYCSFK